MYLWFVPICGKVRMIDDNKKKVAVLVTVIGQKVYSLLRNFVVPMKPHDEKYDELVEAMKNHLKPKPLMITERLKFNRRKQREEALLAELIKLAETCNFGAKLDEQLRNRLVEDLRSGSIQKRVLSERGVRKTRFRVRDFEITRFRTQISRFWLRFIDFRISASDG